jgi:hypothetical protein
MSLFVPVTSSAGTIWVRALDVTPAERSLLAHHQNAIRSVLENRDPWAALEFEGTTVAGMELVSHPDDIEELADRSDLDIDDFYMSVSPK